MDSDLSSCPIQYADGVGPQRAKLFANLGIKTIKDAFYYLPYRYEDRSNLNNINNIRIDEVETVKGCIVSANIVGPRRKKFKIFELVITDGTGLLKAKWFNQPFMKKKFRVDHEVVLSGAVKKDAYWRRGLVMDNPEFEIITEDNDSFIHTKRIVPIYRVTEGISNRQFRKIMFGIVNKYTEKIPNPIPSKIIMSNNLPALDHAVKQVHFSDDNVNIDLLNRGVSVYHRRLSFDELFLFELGLAELKKNAKDYKGIVFDCAGNMKKSLLKILPFALTGAQKKAVVDIIRDMRRPYPMNRLIQGDVGCGKTIVALLAMLYAVECGYQAALMAPTEILAEQHYSNIYMLIEQLGLKTELITSSSKDRHLNSIATGEINIIIGTHALIQEGIIFKDLGLAVIDEQHKFGVMQRSLLRKKGLNPDVLVMTATPIPRSLALTLYGDLDCSIIDELPPSRKPVITRLFNPGQKNEIYKLLDEEIKTGKQAYVVYPAIDESEKVSLKSALLGKAAFEKIFPEYKIELLHGRMKKDERDNIMTRFKNNEVDILVCTTVIEVGVDVPDATIMLIIHAERFGLAQLHQMRGRVGRGADRSYCLLIAYQSESEDAKKRLDIMVKSSDGFKISEEDLKIRGPGEFLGTRQAGMPDLKVANVVRDIDLLEAAKREAFKLIKISPDLKEFPSLRKSLEVFWKGKVDFYKTG
jgi:ATP-dependent DNA helicase RecG